MTERSPEQPKTDKQHLIRGLEQILVYAKLVSVPDRSDLQFVIDLAEKALADASKAPDDSQEILL